MLGIDMSNVTSAGSVNRPGAGGYVIRIQKATVRPMKQDIEIEYDIAEGDFAKYYSDLYNRRGFWLGKFYKSYKEKAMPFLKEFLEVIMDCNPSSENLLVMDGGKLDVDETQLPGKTVGIVYGMEEYIGNDGQVRTRPDYFGAVFMDPEKIRSNDYTVPELKRINAPTAPQQVEVIDRSEDTPMGFNETGNELPF